MIEVPPQVAARDALMKFDEQWEHIASPGHVLLARVNAYRHKSAVAIWIFSAALVFALLSQWLPYRVGAAVAWPVGKLATLFDRRPVAPKMSPAPALTAWTSHLATNFSDPSLLPSPSMLVTALRGAAENIKSGKDIDGCDTTAKITDAWSSSDSAGPHCRSSVDKARLWVWGAMGSGSRYGAFLVVIRKDSQGAVTILNVTGFDPVPGFPQIDPIAVYPRAVAADFPELKG